MESPVNGEPALASESSPFSQNNVSRPFLAEQQEEFPQTGTPGGTFPASLRSQAKPLPRPSSSPLPVAATGSASSRQEAPGEENRNSVQPHGASSSPEKLPRAPQRPLLPGALLQGGRYRVEELIERQNWSGGAFEATWTGRDMRQGQQVIICEVLIPGGLTAPTVSIMRTAALALASIRQYSHVVPILAAFSDQERGFFIFEPPVGEHMLTRLRRLQHPLPEAEVVELCLQICDLLEALEQKSPALVHGLIRPEHIYLSPDGSRYFLSNFSLLAAGRATHYLTGEGHHTHHSPYTAPEFAQGIIDSRSDLYGLLTSAYHLVTGAVPLAVKNVIPHARSINTAVSPAFNAVLTRGLHFVPHQRYQHPSQLRQDLLGVRAQLGQEGFLFPGERGQASSSSPANGNAVFSLATGTDGTGAATPYPFSTARAEDEDFLLPLPEMLPPMQTGNDRLEAALILLGIFLGLGGVTLLSNFHV